MYCFLGYTLIAQRVIIDALIAVDRNIPTADLSRFQYVHALFAGALLEVIFLASSHAFITAPFIHSNIMMEATVQYFFNHIV